MNAEPSTSRPSNLRTALVLASIALVFFAGVIAKYWLFGG
ncbi:MAG: cytochrome oxidase small assembly protein [Betaproteobacteria bacterium]